MQDTSSSLMSMFKWLIITIGLLLTPLVSFLKFQEYPIFSPEMGLVSLGLVIIAVGLAIALSVSRTMVRLLILGTIVVIFADLQFEVRIRYQPIILTIFCILAWLSRRHLAAILAPIIGTVFLSTLLLPGTLGKQAFQQPVTQEVDQSLPAIVHIVLDEHTGPGGVPTGGDGDNPYWRNVMQGLVNGYVDQGFHVFGGAYTRYGTTFNSLPNIMNFAESEEDWYFVGTNRNGLWKVNENQYLETLSQRGYHVEIYQSQYFDFCEDPAINIVVCDSYNYTGLKNIEAVTETTKDRVTIILARYANRSRLYGLARSGLQALAVNNWFGMTRLENNNYAPLAAIPLFDVLTKRVRQNLRGHIIFAHLLIPHRPMLFDESCRFSLDKEFHQLDRDTDLWRRAYRDAYYEQVVCTTTKVQSLIDEILSHPFGEDTIIVVHSDHGSRISENAALANMVDQLSPRDYAATFSSLFAIRHPRSYPGYTHQLLSVTSLLETFVKQPQTGNGPISPASHENPYVFLWDQHSPHLKKVPLPDFRGPDFR